MPSYAFTRSRIFQWIGILLSLGIIAVGYWYFHVYAGYKTNVSSTGSLTSGLIGYWTFDGADTSSTTATDRGSGGNNGTLAGGPAAISGKIGQALNFWPNGADNNSYVNIGDPGDGDLDFGTGDFAVGFWMKGQGYSGQGSFANIVICKHDVNSSTSGGYVFYYGSSNTMIFTIGDASNQYGISAPTSTTADNTWHHYVGVRSGSSIYMYIDGVLVASGSGTSGSVSNSSGLVIGSGLSGNETQTSNSIIDDVRIYNTGLSAAQIQSLYRLGVSDEANAGTSQPQGGNQLDGGLAGYWRLDDGSGTSATDSSTNANTGTLTNGPTWGTGQIAGAGVFDGSNDYIDIPDSNALDPGTRSFSWSFWMKTNQDATSLSWPGIIAKEHDAYLSPRKGWMAYLDTTSPNKVICSVLYNDTADSATSSSALNDNAWHHVTCVRDVIANTVSIYVDGSKNASSNLTNTGTNDISNSLTLQLGGRNSGQANKMFAGSLDEVRIYNRALSVDEVADLYRLTSPTGTDTGLKGYWSFNGKDTTSTTAYDRSGAGNNGTITGAAVTPGKVSQALSFDGSFDSINVGSGSSTNLNAGAFTFSAWVYPYDSQTGYAFILNKTHITESYTFGFNNSGYPYVAINDGSWAEYAAQSSNLALNQWHHFSATREAGGTLRFYINGLQVSSYTGTKTPQSSSGDLVIGAQSNGDYSFAGKMDEVRLYNRALAATEIQSLYKQGQSDETNTGASQPQGGSRLDSGLAGYWALDDGSGTSATDSSTSGNTGTLTNGPTWTTGQIGSAVNFDGSDDYITAGDQTTLEINNSSISVGGWFKLDTLPASNRMFLITKGGTAGTYEYEIAVNQALSNKLRFAVFNTGTGIYMNADTVSAPTTSTWFHVMSVYEPTTPSVKIYYNGVLEGSSTSTSGTITATRTSNFVIGKRDDNAENKLDGLADEVRVYNRALSADEVAELYRLTTPTGTDTGLKGYWSFNGKDVSGTSAYDRSGAGNTGTTSGSPSVTPGKIGQGIALDGSDDYVSIADASSIDYDYNQDFSFSLWVKLPTTQTDTSAGDNFILEKWSGSNGYPYVLRVYNQTYGTSADRGKVTFRRYDGTNAPVVTSTSALNDGNWHHIVGTKSGSTLRIYIDGSSQATATDTTTTTTTNTSPLYIGTRGGSTNNFTGSVDELRLYNRVLSADEVASLYLNR